jgi:hypothetical protein
MMPSYLFTVTPVPNLAEEALGEFETAMRRELGGIQILRRNVRRTINTFYRGKDADENPQFLWLMELEIFGGDMNASVPIEAIDRAKPFLKNHATISSAFQLSNLAS